MFFYTRKEYPSEDALTGALADVLEWSASPALIRSLLARAWTFDGARAQHRAGPDLSTWSTFQVDPWPQWPVGEPDLALRFFAEGQLRAIVVLEAKLGAAKSGVDDVGEGEDQPLPAPNEGDQLGRYFAHANSENSCARVVYLTHHVLPPQDDLQASYAAMRRRVPTASPEQLQWLSWRHVEMVLRDASRTHPDPAFARCLDGVAAVLRGAGFESFTGRWGEGTQRVPLAAASTMLWSWRRSRVRAYLWSTGQALDPVPRLGFYRARGRGGYPWGSPVRVPMVGCPPVIFWGGGSP